MSLSSRELLDEVNEAISGILTTGQSYKVGDRSFTKANLKELREFRRELRQQIIREERRYSGRNHADFSGDGRNSDTGHLPR